MIRHLSAVAISATAVSFAMANDPCPKCANGVANPGPSKPKCDNQIYPLSEMHYIKRYCGPVISPNATYGYFPTQWRAWDGNQTAACQTPASSTPTPTPEVKPEVKPETKPEIKPEVKPEAKPTIPMVPNTDALPKPPMNPMFLPGKGNELAPKPAEKKPTGTPVGALTPAQPVSPGVNMLILSSNR